MNQQEQRSLYDQIYGRDNPRDGAHGWIQWKGTKVCIDLHCECGRLEHFDGDFFYHYECSCGRKYAVGQNVKLILLTEEEAATIDTFDRATVPDDEPDAPPSGQPVVGEGV
jgi:hypothetical protein